MAKKVLFLGMAFAFSTTSLAHYQGHNGAKPYQFYLGVNSGASFHTNQSADIYECTGAFRLTDRETSDARGYNAGLIAGYNFYCHCNMVFGAEFSFNIYTNRGVQTLHFYEFALPATRNFEVSHNMEYSWHLTFHPAFCINPCNSIYLNTGLGSARVSYRTENKIPTSAAPHPVRQEDAETLYGVTLGIGFNHRLSACTSFFTEYQYTHYGEANLKAFKTGGTLADPDGTLKNRTATVDTNVFKIGFSYNF